MFVPIRTDPKRLTAARKGDCGKGRPSRPFSASAGATVLVTGLVVVSYILDTLRPLVPEATVTFDWKSPLVGPGRLMLFEAFVTDQRKTADTRHVEDAHLAIEAFPTRYVRPRELPKFSRGADLPQFARGNNAEDGLGY